MPDQAFQILDGKLDKLIEQLDGTFARRVMSIIFDGESVANVDRSLLALSVMDEIHSQIHRGKLFTASYVFEGVADSANADILFTAPAGANVHMRHSCDVGGDAYLQLFKNVTASADGTAVPITNMNQVSVLTAGTLAYRTPTITDTGSALPQRYIAAGSAGHASGGQGLGFGETIFPAGQKHLIRATNKSGQARTIAINLHFYEVDVA